MIKPAALLIAFLTPLLPLSAEESINVLMWDERQPRQAEAYDNFLGNEIVERLKAETTSL